MGAIYRTRTGRLQLRIGVGVVVCSYHQRSTGRARDVVRAFGNPFDILFDEILVCPGWGVHGLRGIHASQDSAGVWSHAVQDGLGSVRGLVDDMVQMVSSHGYNPIGVPDSDSGAGFWFTGELGDDNDLLYLRARYMNPGMSFFLNLDPFEGVMNRPMSLNGYCWVEGNRIMSLSRDDVIRIWNLADVDWLNGQPD